MYHYFSKLSCTPESPCSAHLSNCLEAPHTFGQATILLRHESSEEDQKPLDKMYNKYMNIETSMLDKMTDITRDIVEDLENEFIKKREKVR